jgi:lysophospholipase L1-like esterase
VILIRESVRRRRTWWLSAGALTLAVPAVLIASMWRPAAVAHGSAPYRIDFLGASITTGYAASPGHGYVQLVVTALERTHPQLLVQRLGRPGAQVTASRLWRAARPAEAIVVQLATNDATGRHPTPLPTFVAEYTRLLQSLRDQSPGARLVCLGAWAAPTAINGAGTTVAVYDDAVRRQCSEMDGVYVELSSIYLNPANHASPQRQPSARRVDTFHPDNRGHATIAAAVLAALGS